MADNIFDTKNIIDALRAKGVPDHEISKLYGPLPPKPNVNLTPEKKPKEKKKKQPKKPLKKNWTTSENERLKKLWASGYSSSELAQEFGVSVDSITSKVKRFKDQGWDGTAPRAPKLPFKDRAKARIRQFGNNARQAGGKSFDFFNRHFGDAFAYQLESGFGNIGRGINNLLKIGHAREGKHMPEQRGGISVEAINNSNKIIVNSLARLNTAIIRGTNTLGKSINKATSKIIDKTTVMNDNIARTALNETVRQHKTAMNGSNMSLGKLALFGGFALAGGVMAGSMLSGGSLFGDDDDDSSLEDDELKKKLEEGKKLSETTELNFKANEIQFKAKDVLFEFDKFKTNLKNLFSGGGMDQDNQGIGSVPEKPSLFPPPSSAPQLDEFGQPRNNGGDDNQGSGSSRGKARDFSGGSSVPFGTSKPDITSFTDPKMAMSENNNIEKMTSEMATLSGISEENMPEFLKTGKFKGVEGVGFAKEQGYFKTLEQQRAEYMRQLENDPQLKKELFALTLAEEGGDPDARRAFMETVFNRAYSRGIKNIGDIIRDKRYYEPYQNGSFQRNLDRINKNPELMDEVQKNYDDVRKGSNQSNLGTDNGSAGVKANAIARGDTLTYEAPNKEGFFRKDKNPGYHGAGVVARTKRWADDTTARMRAEENQRKQAEQAFKNPQPVPFLPQTGNTLLEKQNELDKTQTPPVSENSTEKKPDKVSDSSFTGEASNFQTTVLETQGPNHFEEAGFPSGNKGILA